MPVHPIEERYGSKKMRAIFEFDARFQSMLDVEAALAKALAKVGLIPASDASNIARNANTKSVKVERICEFESIVNHETMALVLALSEAAGKSGRYVHFGATSNDVLDTAAALQIRDGLKIVEKDLKAILKILLALASKHKSTIMVGRTHGQHAVPTTFGMKAAIWASEVGRQIQRLEQLKSRVLVGKMSGAVGTGAAWGKKGLKVQELTMKELGLSPAQASNQILQRDRFAELITFFGLLAGTFEKIAREVRNLQRTEIGELSEPFGEKQVGSSTMPQKRNPIRCERICGISRVIRAQVSAAMENIVLEHERDLTNSSCERILLPQSFLMMNDVLKMAQVVLGDLRVYPEQMRRNLQLTRGLNMAEAVMIELARLGMNRQGAHALMRECSSKAIQKNSPLLDVLVAEPKVTRHIPKAELGKLLDPASYLGGSSEIVENIVKELSPLTK